MKRPRIASLLAGVGILAGAQAALASNGTITFSGALKASTCDINVNGNGNPGGSVALPIISTRTLATTGATAGWTQFDIALTNCEGAAYAMAYFEAGPTVDGTTGRLMNMYSPVAAAQNVQIALRQAVATNNNIIIGGPRDQSTPFPIINGAATLRYQAGYWATGAVTAGGVSARVTYSIVYQ